MMKLNCIFRVLLFVGALACSSGINSQIDKTILLTGAAGFIGSNFLQYMYDKYPTYHFIVLDNLTYAGSLDNIPDYIKNSKRFTFMYGSVTNQALVDYVMGKVDYVVHFAAESHVARSICDDKIFFSTDVMGTRCMMNALVKYRSKVKRFVHISTSEVCGTARIDAAGNSLPMDELTLLEPCSPYAAAKAGADRLVYAYFYTHNVPVVIIRPFNNFGPRQFPEKLIPLLVTQAICGEKLTIHGDGEQKRDWVHTLDLADAVDRALHVPDFSKICGQVIHVGSGKPVSILEIARIILNYFNLAIDRLQFLPDRPGQVRCHISSTAKAKALLGWECRLPLKDAINDVIAWYVKNPEWWQKRLMLAKIRYSNFDDSLTA